MSSFTTFNPSTGDALAQISISDAAAVQAAVARARASSEAWIALGIEGRAICLRAVGAELEVRAEELAGLVHAEMGKPLAEALGEVRGRAKGMDSVIDTATRALEPETAESASTVSHLVRDPLGVVAAIAPWNFPVGMPMSLILPALATGNTVVFKPSEIVPLTGALIAECFQKHLPEGVLELVQGPGETGAALVDADVDMIGFVGSRATGQRVLEAAAGSLKRVVLELGGKDPLVVFADADLDAAADCAVQHSLRNAGQVCCSIERVIVAEDVAEQFEALVLDKAKAWQHDPAAGDVRKMGPMVSERQREIVATQVEAARAAGARVLLGGNPDDAPGYFYPATVVADVAREMSLSADETFGPVVALSRFSGTEDDAVALANDTPYGLGANVYTADRERGLRVASRIRSGQVGVNRYLTNMPGSPWVGQKQSGFGYIGGIEGYRQFTSPKTISLSLA